MSYTKLIVHLQAYILLYPDRITSKRRSLRTKRILVVNGEI